MNRKYTIIICIILIIILIAITIGSFWPKKTEPLPKVDIIYDTVNQKMYMLSDDILYEQDNLQSIQKQELVKGSEIYVEECSNTGWCKISFNDEIGYVQKELLTDEAPEIIEEPPIEPEPTEPETEEEPSITKVNETVYATTDANIRSSMDYGDNIVGVLSFNEPITRVGIVDNKWSIVLYNGQECYIATSILTTIKVEIKPIDLNVKQNPNIDPSKPMVAITFDDGPGGEPTNRILDTLEQYKVKATFFDLGTKMYKYPETVKREAALGEVGTHTNSHLNLNTQSIDKINEEINAYNQAFMDILGEKPKLLRPPYGNANNNVKAAITEQAIINWNVDTLDWKSRDKDQIINKIYEAGDLDGDIILFHGIYESTADAIEYIVPYLIGEGYQLVTVSELATYKGANITTGVIYYHF